ncbi:MAG: hypothetical protein QXE34_01880 [Candidatus Aenigmatarchaeota archaeon]|nr:hypothetical protein [Candidatus Aenigmarchaeota archaeon]
MSVGQTVLDRISNFYQELKKEGLLKVTLPIIQDSSLWKQSGRWELKMKC